MFIKLFQIREAEDGMMKWLLSMSLYTNGFFIANLLVSGADGPGKWMLRKSLADIYWSVQLFS